jgi:DNA helicase IV
VSEIELRAELEHHDRVRSAMATMRNTTVQLLGRYESDFVESRRNRRPGDARPDHNMGFAMAWHSAARLDDLADRDVPLFFGRLWLDSGESFHLGRRHIRDEADRSVALVVDWRAPLAERFYRASAHRRHEVAKRRRFGFEGSTLTSLEDEDLRLGTDFSSTLLTKEIERPRTGPMRDIVATIQPEQDELIRRDADTTLCVQGAPGTGKTAVGLHRAAWLLYTYPGKLGTSGMLVVGPNDGFLRYIAGVLPTLGETSVWQVTVGELTGSAEAPGTDAGDVALVKHDARMSEVCERAVWAQLGEIEDDLAITHTGVRYTVEADYLTEAVRRARTTCRTWNSGRKSLEEAVVRGFVRRAEEQTGRARDNRWASELKRQAEFKQLMDRAWPRLTAKQVLRRLYADEAFRASVCADLLPDREADLLRGGKGALKLSAADIVLLDEIQAQLQPLTTQQTYGHIVIDEAQDLSPMECRAIARRCPPGSLTVLGDLAQGTTPWAAADWKSQMGHLDRVDAEYTELTTGFRVPDAIIRLANRVLPHLDVPVSPAVSVRYDGSVDVVTGDDPVSGALDAVQNALTHEGMVGVIAVDPTLERLRRELPDHPRLELVPAPLAKGLEFDHVVVVEPADFTVTPAEGAGPGRGVGLRHLYVALTRAVSRLTLVHSRPLPPELDHISPR